MDVIINYELMKKTQEEVQRIWSGRNNSVAGRDSIRSAVLEEHGTRGKRFQKGTIEEGTVEHNHKE